MAQWYRNNRHGESLDIKARKFKSFEEAKDFSLVIAVINNL